MRILGIDSGFTRPGFAVVDIDETTLDLDRSTLVEVLCIETEREDKKTRRLENISIANDDSRRIREVSQSIVDIVARTKPDLAVVELPISGAKSAMAIKGMAFSTATFVSTLHCLKVDTVLISPFDNKIASTMDHHAEKEEVIAAVVKIWADINWPLMKLKSRCQEPDRGKQEAIADALSTIITYVKLKQKNAKLVLVQYE